MVLAKKIYLIAISTTLFVLSGSVHAIAEPGSKAWFDPSNPPKLELLQQNVEAPIFNYWNIPCSTINTKVTNYNYWGQPEGVQQMSSCALYAPYGYIVENKKLALAGTDTAYEVQNSQGQTLQSFLAPLPGTNDLLNFNDVIQVYSNIPYNTSSVNGVLSSGLNGTSRYKLTTNPGLVKYTNGSVLQGIRPNGFSFSRYGGKVVVNIGAFQSVVDAKTLTARKFGSNSLDYGTSTSTLRTSLNSNGSVVVANNGGNPSRYSLYNLDNCSNTSSGSVEVCQTFDYGLLVMNKVSNFRSIASAKFISDTEIELVIESGSGTNKRFDKYKFTNNEDGAGMQYLALGDSYASGEGSFDYKSDTDTTNNRCHNSLSSYPYLIKNVQQLGLAESISCSGALIKDVIDISSKTYDRESPQGRGKDEEVHNNDIYTNFLPGYRRQYDFVEKYKPEVITLSVGGNNIGFGNKLRTCILTPTNCYQSTSKKESILKEIKNQFVPLAITYTSLKTVSPNSRIYIIGYPQIAKPDGNCAVNVRLGRQELELAENIITDLNKVIELAAKKAGVFYVDTSMAFNGSRLCEDQSWNLAVNGVTAGNDSPVLNLGPIGSETYHPNKLGHILYKGVIQQKTAYFSKPMPEPNDSVDLNFMSALIPSQAAGPSPITTPIFEDVLAKDTTKKGDTLSENLTTTGYFLSSGTNYRVEIHSTPIVIGSAVATSSNSLSIAAKIPDTIEAGAHTIHIYGNNINGEPIDIYKDIVVIASEDDHDGDGIPNNEDQCQFIEPSSLDEDNDGIDDACDPYIGESPVQDTEANAGSVTDTDSGDNKVLSNHYEVNRSSTWSSALGDLSSDTLQPVLPSQMTNSTYATPNRLYNTIAESVRSEVVQSNKRSAINHFPEKQVTVRKNKEGYVFANKMMHVVGLSFGVVAVASLLRRSARF